MEVKLRRSPADTKAFAVPGRQGSGRPERSADRVHGRSPSRPGVPRRTAPTEAGQIQNIPVLSGESGRGIMAWDPM